MKNDHNTNIREISFVQTAVETQLNGALEFSKLLIHHFGVRPIIKFERDFEIVVVHVFALLCVSR